MVKRQAAAKEKAARKHNRTVMIRAITIAPRDVLKRCKASPEELKLWKIAGQRELQALIDRGVLRLVKISELSKDTAHSVSRRLY